MVRIIGIDPGLANTGWGVLDAGRGRLRHVGHGTIPTEPGCSNGERLLTIFDRLTEIVEKYRPQEAGIESLYFAKNISSALPVAQARGIVLLTFARNAVVAAEYPPQAIKQAIVGRGRAEKSQVQELVRVLLGLKDVPRPDHAADALAAAICHAHSRELPKIAGEAALPATQRHPPVTPAGRRRAGAKRRPSAESS